MKTVSNGQESCYNTGIKEKWGLIVVKNQKVTALHDYSKNNTLQNIRLSKRRKAVRRRATVIVIGGLFLIGLTSLPVIRNKQTAGAFEEQAIELAKELEEKETEKKELEYQVSLLEDEEYIAKLARKELNLAKENEILINLPELKEALEDAENE